LLALPFRTKAGNGPASVVAQLEDEKADAPALLVAAIV
jgi:hypothetical protein